jgi:hypothetical protein
MAWQTVADFKAQTGVTLDDALVQSALDSASAIMKRYIFIKRIYRSTTTQVQHIFSGSTTGDPRRVYVGDYNTDSIITSADLIAYEIDSTFTETSLNPSIATFNYKYGVVNFSTAKPTAGRILYIEWYEAITDLETILPIMIEVNQLEAVNFLFTKVPFEKLQSGISQWTLNGVTVDFNRDAMAAVIASNNDRLKKLYNLLIPLYTQKTTLQAPPPNRMSDFMTTLTFRGP